MEKHIFQDPEKELLTLLIEVDHPDNAVTSNVSKNEVTDNCKNLLQCLPRKISQILMFIVSIPIMLITFAVYVIVWFLISIATNAFRLIIAKLRGHSFKLEWADWGASGMAGTIGHLKIMIYPNDHPPPHFHIVTDIYNAKFYIETCELIDGVLPGKHIKVIRKWHANRVDFLRDKWRITRPGGVCN